MAATVQLCSQYFRVGILTDPVLQVGLMIIYVYIVCLLIFFLLQILIGAIIDLVGLSNFLWLRNTIARERGIGLTAPGCHWRRSGRPPFRRENGKRCMRGRPTIRRPILPSRDEY